METTEISTEVLEKKVDTLTRALADLFVVAHSNDVVKTAAAIGLGEEQVRRYLRGVEMLKITQKIGAGKIKMAIESLDKAKEILDTLRPLTVERAHSIIGVCEELAA